MKFGLIIHAHTQNVGDDIQAYAASSLLPGIDYIIDREDLPNFDSKEDVAVIMCGWYLWAKWNWPPASQLIPLITGFHYTYFQIPQQGAPIDRQFLTGPGYEYLKNYEPIGCRDLNTKEALEDIGLEAFFSGCITLTLPKMPVVKSDKEYICLVDVGDGVYKRAAEILEGTFIEIKVVGHYRDYRNTTDTWEKRGAYVEELLTLYQNAKCVLTSRLHCALPCLAMEVPVLLIKSDLKSERFRPYFDWINTVLERDFNKGECTYSILNPPRNHDAYKQYRNDMVKTINKFISEVSSGNRKPQSLQHTDIEIMQWQNKLMKDTLYKWLIECRKLLLERNKYRSEAKETQKSLSAQKNKVTDQKKELDTANKKNEELNKQIAKLQADLKNVTMEVDKKTKALVKKEEVILKQDSILKYKSVRLTLKIRKILEKLGLGKLYRRVKK